MMWDDSYGTYIPKGIFGAWLLFFFLQEQIKDIIIIPSVCSLMVCQMLQASRGEVFCPAAREGLTIGPLYN